MNGPDIIEYPDFEQNRIYHEQQKKTRIIKNIFLICSCILSFVALCMYSMAEFGMYLKGYIVLSKTFICTFGFTALSMILIAVSSIIFIKSEKFKWLIICVGALLFMMEGYYFYNYLKIWGNMDYILSSYYVMNIALSLFAMLTGVVLIVSGANFLKKTIYLSFVPLMEAFIYLCFFIIYVKNMIGDGYAATINMYLYPVCVISLCLFYISVFALLVGINKKNDSFIADNTPKYNDVQYTEIENKSCDNNAVTEMYKNDNCIQESKEEPKYDQYNRF